MSNDTDDAEHDEEQTAELRATVAAACRREQDAEAES